MITIKTYQDLLAVGDDDKKRMDFVRQVISEHKGSGLYREAVEAELYEKRRNVTINSYQKLLYTVTGKAVPDNYSANWKMASGFFQRFVLQENQYLLGNGVTWQEPATGARLGEDFDTRLQELGKDALIGGVAFGFFNLDHMDVFKVTEFAPILDEDDGAVKAGVRFWQIDGTKPLRATFYELDGYTDYIWKKGKGEILYPKRAYIIKIRSSQADGAEIYDFENYPTFPIVPLWGNPAHQSELTGLREQIDCYDLIKSGFANDVDEASMIYWTIQNAGGMDDVDLARFVERMKTVHAATVDDTGAQVESHTVEVPYASRDSILDRISKDLYRDAMALDTENIASGAVTATQIKAAYEPLDRKCDEFEYCIHDFLDAILAIAGIEDKATFTRSKMVNATEEVQAVLQAAQYLEDDYVTRKLLTVFGDGDLADEMLKQMDADELDRMASEDNGDASGIEEGLGDEEDDGIDAELDALLAELEEE